MPNEFKVKNGLVVDSGGAIVTGSITAKQTGFNTSGIFTGDALGGIALTTTASNGFSVFTIGGALQIYDNTNAATRFTLSSAGNISVNAITSSGMISIGRTTTSQAVIQRAQTPAGAYSTILAAGTGIVDTFPYTMADGHGATVEMRAGDPISDQYGGGILITANGNTSPLGEGNAIVFKNRTGTNTYTERMRITYDGNIQLGQRSLTGTSSDLISASTTANTTCDEAISQFTNFRSMHIKYNIQDSTGGNYRAGTVMAITDGSGNITSIDTATSDIGNTSSVVLTVVLTNSGQNMTLEVNNGLADDVTVVTEYTML